MKNLGLLLIYLIVAMSACHKKTKVPHYLLSDALKATFGYKVGSFWIYKDSISGSTDSFFVRYSNFSTENNGDALIDRIDMNIIGYENNSIDSEIWIITMIDSTFQINFKNNSDIIESQLSLRLFTYPFKIQNIIGANYDTGYIANIFPSFNLDGQVYPNTAVSFHKNTYNYHPIIYNDYFYISSSSGIVKIIFNHPQDSVYRILELQRFSIKL